MIRRILRSEALAYLKSTFAPKAEAWRRVGQSELDPSAQAGFGVLFVPGVGATSAQFSGLRRTLLPHADVFLPFDYSSLAHPRIIARDLARTIEAHRFRCPRILAIGHSLGGLLLRMVLQSDDPPPSVVGWVSISAPLHGTRRSRLAPTPSLRTLHPETPLIEEVNSGVHRLKRLDGRILTIGTRSDLFIEPWSSAFLDEHEKMELDDVGHVGLLFDARVHAAIARFAERVKGDYPLRLR